MVALLLLLGAGPPRPALDPAWHSPRELLPAIARRWALPEALAGRAWVGGRPRLKAILDEACKGWGLSWTEANGVVVVHRADDARLERWSKALRAGSEEAAWELGWLGDGRALPVLAEALAGKDVAASLAAAHAIGILLAEIPMGREERVDAPLPGRVSLAVAFPPKADLRPLLASPYPPVRAAALRILLGQGAEADARPAPAVEEVRQQFRPLARRTPSPLLPVPADVKAACARMAEELPGLEKRSEWEVMTRRADSMGDWARRGHAAAREALLGLAFTKVQPGWYPGIVQKCLAASGSPEALAAVKAILPKASMPFVARGLEESVCGAALVAFTGPYLADPTVCYVTARKAGREALPFLLPLADKGNAAAIDALGLIGGTDAVKALARALAKDEPRSSTLAFRAAKALSRAGSAAALDALLAADAASLARRHAVAMALGRIGGPKAEARLLELAKDDARLVRAAAADGLEQIGTKDALAAAAAFRKGDAGPPPLAFAPRNPRFAADFPVNEWVNLRIDVKAQGWGEIGWNYDPANRLFFRYGGCTGPYNNELTAFDLGTEQFTQRRPIELMAGWGDARPGNGCTAGRTWDPWLKSAWIVHGIGGTANQLGMLEYHSRSPVARFGTYDLATDRFRAVPYREASYGERATRLACDWKTGLVMPVKVTHPVYKVKDFPVLDVKGGLVWRGRRRAEGPYPRHDGAAHTTGAVDQDAGLLVLYVPPIGDRPPQTWTYDPATDVWQDRAPKVQPHSVAGGGFAYDPFHKVLVLQGGKKATQFGGPDDSLTWSYDVRTNAWTDLKAKNGPGSAWLGAMDFDPEHNVFVLFNFRDKRVWAYRHKAVKPGTRAD